ncbi:MAG: hypothetical protein ACOYNN_14780 [Terrimicrobiaceae bacterium]
MSLRTTSSGRPAEWQAILIILALFAVSLAIREPVLNRPLAGNQEWLTSTVLRTMEIWQADGAIHGQQLLPSMTYPGAANRFIPNHANLIAPNGECYYTSYPSLGYYVPYFVTSIIGMGPSVTFMRVFCLCVHLICVLLVFALVRVATRPWNPFSAELAAIAAAGLYIFATGTLWYHGNVYMSDMLVQMFFLAGTLLGLRLLRTVPGRVVDFIFVWVIIFAMTLTEWIGGLFAISLAIAAFRAAGWRRGIVITLLAGTASGLAVAATVLHYSSIDGFANLVESLRVKAEIYSAAANTTGTPAVISPKRWLLFARHYFDSYAGFACAIAALSGFIVLSFRKQLTTFTRRAWADSDFVSVVWLLAAPILLHHFILFNWTTSHSFSVLKTAPLIALVFGVLVLWVLEGSREKGWTCGLPLVVAIFLMGVASSIFMYFHSNLVHDENYRASGNAIQRGTGEDEIAFVSVGRMSPRRDLYWQVHPQLVFYAKRNLAVWLDGPEASRLLNTVGIQRGVLFTLTPDWQIIDVRRFNLGEVNDIDRWLRESGR